MGHLCHVCWVGHNELTEKNWDESFYITNMPIFELHIASIVPVFKSRDEKLYVNFCTCVATSFQKF